MLLIEKKIEKNCQSYSDMENYYLPLVTRHSLLKNNHRNKTYISKNNNIK